MPSTMVSTSSSLPYRVPLIRRASLKCSVKLLPMRHKVAAMVLIRTKPPFKPSGICQAEPAPARRTMYPQIRPENSIASEARNVSMPKRTTFGPTLWGAASMAIAEALILRLYDRSTISKQERAGLEEQQKSLRRSASGDYVFLALRPFTLAPRPGIQA